MANTLVGGFDYSHLISIASALSQQ